MTSTPQATKRPAPGVPRPYRFPAFTRTTLDNGLDVIAAHLPGRQLGAARLILDTGATGDPLDQAGISVIAGRALSEGTEDHDAAGFAEAAERLGADIGFEVGWDALQGSVVVPMSRLEPALDLLAEATLRPTFPDHEVERVLAERLNEIKQEFADPSQRAHVAFLQAIYAPTAPYARPAAGTPDTIADLDPELVAEHYRTTASPQGAALVIAGDLEGLDVPALAAKLFGGWEAPTTAAEQPGAVTGRNDPTAVTLVHRPGSVQSALIAGHVGVRRHTPDYFAINLMAAILGGLFTSRLNLTLREEKGYTYGARAGFDFRRQAGPFAASTAVAGPVTLPALQDALTEIRALHAGGVTAEELAFAQDYLVGIFPLAFETPEAICQAIARLVVHRLADDYYDTYRPEMQAVTVEEATGAAATYLHPDRMAVVVVGDGETLEQPLKDAGIGPVTVIEDDEGDLDVDVDDGPS